MKNITPAMRQYYEAKEQYPDALILFRMGDFYESFGEDAKLLSKELDIALTTRGRSKEGEKMPLAGIPYHAIDTYLPRLIKKGYKVAICEQLEDPKQAKGVVKRGVVRIVTPGTAIDSSILTDPSNNYLMVISGASLQRREKKQSDKIQEQKNEQKTRMIFGLAFLDISTGSFLTCQFEDTEPFERVISEAAGIQPAECIVQASLRDTCILIERLEEQRIKVEYKDFSANPEDIEAGEESLCKQFGIETLEGLGIHTTPYCIVSCAQALQYALETQMRNLDHIKTARNYSLADHMVLDSMTLRNLEVLKNVHDEKTDCSLYHVLDRTKTAMGKRTLKTWLLRPLIVRDDIENRLESVDFIKTDALLQYDLSTCLAGINDIERLIVRMSYGNSNARDLISLKNSLEALPRIISLLSENGPGILAKFREDLMNFTFTESVVSLISRAIVDEPPLSVREGHMIRKGYNENIDELRALSGNSKEWIAQFQAKERERTGIKSLKVSYNKVFGYFIEVTKSNISQVPDNYIRKQTMANAERFFTPELKDQEDKILSADEKSIDLEYDIFRQITENVCQYVDEIREIAAILGAVDVLVGFSTVSSENNYVKPEISDSNEILIRDGRHPVVESVLCGHFVPNDTEINDSDKQILLITGPNMAGKSTYMRQIAMIVLMAQTGCFVPASYAKIGIVDRIFTRIGAYDDLTAGQSTFMVEMIELANILNNASSKSLVLLDEIGRGTSTYDGYSIAKAAVEYIHDKNKTGVRTLFATHYHQLTILEERLKRLKNFHIAVRESGHELIFLRKIVPGATDKSYGIHVARIAGVPEQVVRRADEILQEIEQESMIENTSKNSKNRTGVRYTQLMFWDPEIPCSSQPASVKAAETKRGTHEVDPKFEKLKQKMKDTNINNITPLEALSLLSEIKRDFEK